MKIREVVYEKIMCSYKEVPPESGGILGIKNGVVEFYFHDYSSQKGIRYVPNVKSINRVINVWAKQDIFFAGFIHSHANIKILTKADKDYIKVILRDMPYFICKMYFPIVIPNDVMISHVALKIGNLIILKKDKINFV